jgi:HD superfamily phosphohydrolase/tRNA A-37 threonylcarbamoyl transferase component Bud32
MAHPSNTRTSRPPLEFRANKPLQCDEAYSILDKEPRSRRTIARPIGQGAVGVVYRARYKNRLDRAIKFLAPDVKGDQQAHLSLPRLQEKFTAEITLLSKITHTNICKIVDFGTYSPDSEGRSVYPYYVMEFVEGARFGDYWSSCDGRTFLNLVAQLVDAVVYLHSIGYYHMDIKEENVFVRSQAESNPQTVLLDLGGAKPCPTSDLLALDSTTFISTEKATRRWRRPFLAQQISYDLLATWGTDVDLFAIGAMTRRALENEEVRRHISDALGSWGLVALEWIIERLVEGSSDDWLSAHRHYRTALQLRDDLDRLQPNYMWPLGLPELSLVVGPHSVQLATERVGLTPHLMELVNHALFQRLHNIPQLEYVNLIYPGAHHTRFEHSLSTFQLARTFITRLLQFPDFRMIAAPEYVEGTLLAALLHDIGHYPLSHMFEDFSPDRWTLSAFGEGHVASDDDLFPSLVCPQPGDPIALIVQQALEEATESDPTTTSFHKLLTETYPNSHALLPSLLRPPRNAPVPVAVLHGLLASAIDIDKISYLSGDSAATGVAFGRGIDLHGLLDALVPPKLQDQHRAGIAITEDGLQAAESIVMARFWMIARVYWHRTNRSIMAMHKFVIADLMESGALRFYDYFRRMLFGSQPIATRYLYQLYHEAHIGDGPQSVVNPLAGLIGSNRHVFDRLLTIGSGRNDRETELYRRIQGEGTQGLISLAETMRSHLTVAFRSLSLRYGDVLVDMPLKRRESMGSGVLVYLNREPNLARDLVGGEHAVSETLRYLSTDFEHHVKKCRVFLHPSAMKAMEEAGLLDKVRDSLRQCLEDSFGIQ